MAPLRVALIGLSASATTSWASTSHLPAVLSPAGREYYSITALLNSSVAAAQRAIQTYPLPATTTPHGGPESLAADPDVDVVVVCNRVDKHLDSVLPSVRRGKGVYVEWPIASNLSDMELLLAEAKKSGVRVAVGLQERFAPHVVRMRSILQGSTDAVEGGLGKLLSSTVRGYGAVLDRGSLSPGLRYFGEREVGGNGVVIGFGHMIDYVQSVVGELEKETTHARLQVQRGDVRIRHSDGDEGVKDEWVRSDVPDLVSVHGSLPETDRVAKHATLSVFNRNGQPFKGEPAFVWAMNFERGEVRLTSPGGAMFHSYVSETLPRIEVHEFASDTVKEVEVDWSEGQKEMSVGAMSVLACLVAFARGDEKGYVGLEEGIARAKQIQAWLDGCVASS